MAQNLVAKRQRIAGTAVASASAVVNGLNGLLVAKAERAQAGNFEESDLETPELEHLTAFLVGLTLDIVVGEIATFLDGKVEDNPASPKRIEVLLQMKR